MISSTLGFRIDLDGQGVADFAPPVGLGKTELADGSLRRSALWASSRSGLQVRVQRATYPGTRVGAQWLEATNAAPYPLTVTR